MAMFHSARAAIDSFHRAFLRRPLPDKLALYTHSLRGRSSTLEQVMLRFAELGYRFVAPNEFTSLSGRMIMLTFDDNYQSWYSHLSMFDRLGAKVTFYVNTAPFRDRATIDEMARFFSAISANPEPTLSVEELKCIADAGHTIGAHTHTHPNLAKVPFVVATEEITTSKRILEDILGEPVVHFAYPFGMRRHFSGQLMQFCFDSGFETVATGLPAMQHAKSPRGVIHRSAVLLDSPFERCVEALEVDGRIFERITGRNPVSA